MRLILKHRIGTRGSSSEALTNHLAFTYYGAKDLLALPMTICEEDPDRLGQYYSQMMTFSGLMVFDVTLEGGFSEKGRVSFPKAIDGGCSQWWTQSTSVVKRSIFIGDYVYSLTDDLLKVNRLDDLSRDLVSLPLD